MDECVSDEDPMLQWLDMMGDIEFSEAPGGSATVTEEPATVIQESAGIDSARAEESAGIDSARAEASPSNRSMEDLWADPIKETLRAVREARGKQIKPALIASGCSGLVSEARALRRLEVDTVFLFCSDPMLESWNFAKSNGPDNRMHWFRDLAQVAYTGKGYCYDHQKECEVTMPEDCLKPNSTVVGFTCTPYTTSSIKRPAGTTVHSESHLFDAFLDEMIRNDSDEGWAENVFGVLHRESAKDPQAPITRMIADANAKAPAYDVAVFFLDGHNHWVMTRRRVYIHLLHERVGGKVAHERMKRFVMVTLRLMTVMRPWSSPGLSRS